MKWSARAPDRRRRDARETAGRNGDRARVAGTKTADLRSSAISAF